MNKAAERLDQRPVGGLLTDLISQVTALFRTEVNLLKSEMKDKFRAVSGALVTVAIGAALLVAAVIALVQAAVAGMVAAGMTVWLASLIVGAALGVIGFTLITGGAKKMSLSEMTPDRTVRQVGKDVTLVKEAAK